MHRARTHHVGNSPTLTSSDLPKRTCSGYNLTRANSRPGQVAPFPDEENVFRQDQSRPAPQVCEANLHLTKFPAIVTEGFEPDWSILQSHKSPDATLYCRRVGPCLEFLLPHPCMQGCWRCMRAVRHSWIYMLGCMCDAKPTSPRSSIRYKVVPVTHCCLEARCGRWFEKTIRSNTWPKNLHI